MLGELDVALVRDFERIFEDIRTARERTCYLIRILEIQPAVVAHAVRIGAIFSQPDAKEHVVGVVRCRGEEVRIVRCDDGEVCLFREGEDQPIQLGLSLARVCLHFQVVAVRKTFSVPVRHPFRTRHVSRQEVLRDLSGHTGGNRLPLFARRAAPIQVTYIGYPNTTGLATMDYRLTDAWADPLGIADKLYTEELVRLDGGHLCYRPPGDSPPVGEPPVLRSGHITFGSFNNLAKVNPALVARWASILNGVPGSRLMLKTKPLADAGARDVVRQAFAQNGVAQDRLVLSGWTDDTAGHLAQYADVDIALDTLPYHGTTTTCEALWMGVPVVTCAGETHASRVGLSLLSAIGLDELVTCSMQDYVETAISLAHDIPRLGRLRSALRTRMATSAITDKARIARAVEDAYRAMWVRFIRQTRPHQFAG